MKSLTQIVHEALQTMKLPKSKNPFKQDLRIGGGMEHDGGNSKTYHSDDGTEGSGGYTRQGTKGFSRAAKEFDEPIDSIPLDKSNFDNHIGEPDEIEETEEIWSDLPVGQRVPELGDGNRGGPGLKPKYLGYRKK